MLHVLVPRIVLKKETKKGAHHLFQRTPLRDEFGIFDCARGVSDTLPSDADGILLLNMQTI